ncbi:MAG: proton-conducting transporter membrane subunit, partial [Sulfolobaceae archaeon]
MLPLIVFILSFLVAALIFLSNNKNINSILSALSILINIFFILNQGLFFTFPVSSGIGSFGFVVNYLNFPFIITILIITSLTVIYSLRYMEVRFHELGGGSWRIYYGLYTLFSISMLYTVLSTNLLEAYIFIEIALVTSFGLILLYGYGDRRRISLLYFIWTHVGTILTLSSILILGIQTGRMDIYQDSFTILNYSNVSYAPLIFILGIIGMFVKAALAGFNIWLPYAHGEAPTPISVLLSPNMVGLGVFVVILYFYLFPNLSYLSPIFIIWALITMIYGGINAIAQKDFKRYLAYSSVSQMGYMALGASISYYIGLSNNITELPLGILASVLIYASHGFGKAILFMSAGATITELNNRNIEKLGGLYLNSPIHTTLSFIGILNLLGLPPTIGLVSEVLLLLSAGALAVINFPLFIIVFILLLISIGVSAGYATYLFKKVYAGVNNLNIINDKILEYTLPMLLISSFSILFFFFPNFLTYSTNILGVEPFNTYNPLPAVISLIPLLGSLLSLLIPRQHQDLRGGLSTLLIGVSALLAGVNLGYTLLNYNGEFYLPQSSFNLFSYFTFSSSLLQAILGLFVSSLSFFIALYSIGYMKEDRVLRRYWGLFNLFVSSMLMVVYSDNILLFMAGWEGTGLASYALISYWLDDNEKNVVGDFGRRIFGIEYVSKPTISGIRALVFTRIGDVGLLIGLGFLLYLISKSSYILPNSFDIYNSLFVAVGSGYSFNYFWLILILMALGGLAKSAQFPFTQWLLTAMTGPTPVSALIHAATMVNLGAIFTFIFYPFLNVADSQTFLFLLFMVIISGFTAIYTSLNALGSNEQKVILAYSTADQISLMIFSSSLGGFLAYALNNKELLYLGIAFGLIQMISHGIYKATLFMNTGSVIHLTESRYVGHNI